MAGTTTPSASRAPSRRERPSASLAFIEPDASRTISMLRPGATAAVWAARPDGTTRPVTRQAVIRWDGRM
jgi:hypothetical protein